MSKTVLVIEDNRDNRDIILEFLSAFGFDVTSAVDGAEGLEKFYNDSPDMVLSDVLLPKINGFGVCEKIKNSPDPVPVILMSALYKTHSLQAEARQKYGADDYLLKPLNLLELANRICQLLKITKEGLAQDNNNQKDSLAVPEIGSFSEYPPPALFGFLFRHKKTGILTCQGRVKKTVYVQEGIPIYVTSEDPEETYIAMLIADKKITADQKKELEDKAAKEKTTFGKLLILEKLVSNADLTEYMLEEVHLRLVDLISWSEGDYAFRNDQSFLKKIKRPKMKLARSLYRGIQKGDFWEYISKRYYAISDRVVNKIEDNLPQVAEIDLKMEDLETFALIDNKNSIQEILSVSERDNISIFNLIWTLELNQIVSLN